LTVPEELRRPELQVLVHGAGADHRSWDFPLEPQCYSYVQWAAARGAATLAIDRIGCGGSTRPSGRETTIEAQAATLSQVVAAARNGIGGVAAFDRVVLVGASLGSVIAGTEAAMFADVDAVVLTAYLPIDGAPEVAAELFDAAFRPAAERLPHLLGLVDDDYLATVAADDGSWLYRAEHAHPAVIAAADQMTGTTTRAELTGAIAAGPTVRRSTVPTLVLVGQYDPLMYDPAADADTHDPTRRLAAQSPNNFEFEVIADTGHALNLHDTAHTTFEAIERWLDQVASSPDGATAQRAREVRAQRSA
jgi:pimeloyl-ACP methyl ester carboxylesterase